jgi:hypothetical protein
MESAAEHEEEPKAPECSASQKSLPETTPVPDDEEEEEEDEKQAPIVLSDDVATIDVETIEEEDPIKEIERKVESELVLKL